MSYKIIDPPIRGFLHIKDISAEVELVGIKSYNYMNFPDDYQFRWIDKTNLKHLDNRSALHSIDQEAVDLDVDFNLPEALAKDSRVFRECDALVPRPDLPLAAQKLRLTEELIDLYCQKIDRGSDIVKSLESVGDLIEDSIEYCKELNEDDSKYQNLKRKYKL